MELVNLGLINKNVQIVFVTENFEIILKTFKFSKLFVLPFDIFDTI